MQVGRTVVDTVQVAPGSMIFEDCCSVRELPAASWSRTYRYLIARPSWLPMLKETGTDWPATALAGRAQALLKDNAV
jgi:hypothetical protein